ncbi:MAG: hypothetical protein LBJ74_05850 [Heliobacteriaceae bacterium]|jgi:hypothetical protein|nr:hypothetical protein [Heliobacteriaceae bacterium]
MAKWKPLLFYLTLFLLIWAFAATAANYDFDLWARLIAGSGVVDHGQVYKADFLSYTPTRMWIDHEYGSGVIFYLFLKFFGPYSLVLLHTMLIFGIFFTASKVVKLRLQSPLNPPLQGGLEPYNILFYFLAFIALIPTINSPVRCHLFSFLLFTVFIYILELARKGNDKPLYLIPLITIFWNNVHGSVAAGLGLIAMYAAGEFWTRISCHRSVIEIPDNAVCTPQASTNSRFRDDVAKKYLITLFVSCLTLFINPWGWDYIKFLIMANIMHRPDVSEWWGIFSKFHMFKWFQFKLFMVFIIITMSLRGAFATKQSSQSAMTIKSWIAALLSVARNDMTKLIVLLVTLYLAITHLKLIPFFIIASLCYVYEDFYALVKPFKERLIIGLLLGISVFTLAVKELTVPLDFKAYPVQEVEFIKINNLEGDILTNFGLGSYVSYKLYPHNLIFMDGRYEEVYHDFMVPLLKKFYLVTPGWDEVLQKFPPDCMIIEKYYPVYNVLKKSKDWQLVYEGPVFGVFVKPAAKKEYKTPSEDIEYYRKRLFNRYE